MFVDIFGEITITKDGATFLRKIDVEHPVAKVMIDASNAVDNEVGDGTISVVVLAGALLERADELLDLGIAPSIIADGYSDALDLSLNLLNNLSEKTTNDRQIMLYLAQTCLNSKLLSIPGSPFVVEIKERLLTIRNPVLICLIIIISRVCLEECFRTPLNKTL